MLNKINTIYFGFDESNHAGPNRKGEVVVCTYSLNREDSLIKQYTNRRKDNDLVNKWLKQDQTGYKFTILSGEEYKYRDSSLNLMQATPNLVTNILTDPDLNLPNPKKIKLYFDGRFDSRSKIILKDHFSSMGIKEVIIANFVKGKKDKPRGPKLIHLADLLARDLYQTPFGEVSEHKNLIPHEKLIL